MTSRTLQSGDEVRVTDDTGCAPSFRVGDYAKVVGWEGGLLQVDFNDSRNARVSGDGFFFVRPDRVTRTAPQVLDWPDETQLTPAERTAINLTAQLWNTASQLPDQHPSDVAELQADIHAIQNRIMARLARRRHPEIFR